jgi:hypothetical protein
MKNIKELLVDATKLPAAVEAKLPAGAPKISTMLVDAAGKIPAVPDFPMEIPNLPEPPELPAMPALPGGAGLRRYVTGVEVTQVQQRQAIIPSPAVGVIPEVMTRRGM